MEAALMPWWFGFVLGISVAVIGAALRGPVPAHRRRKIQRPWWMSQDRWDRRRGFTEAQYRAWRESERGRDEGDKNKDKGRGL
jgi:hypothetical protein